MSQSQLFEVVETGYRLGLLIDAALGLIQERIIEHGYDEIVLPPQETEFSEKRLGITWKGTLILTNGKFGGLQTIHRVGEPQVSYNGGHHHGEIKFTVDLALTNPTLTYDFHLVFMNNDKVGNVVSKVTSVTLSIVIALSILSRRMYLVDMKIKDIGDIDADVVGMGAVLDFLVTKVMRIALNQRKHEIAREIEARMQTYFREIVDNTPWPTPPVPDEVMVHGV